MQKALLLISVYTIIMTSCTNRRGLDRIVISEAQMVGVVTPVSVYPGKWIFSNTMWYKAVLDLRKDGRFHYQENSCLSVGSSQGTWHQKNGYIILTSDQRKKELKKEIAGFLSYNQPIDFVNMKLYWAGDVLSNVNLNTKIPDYFYLAVSAGNLKRVHFQNN